MSGVQARCVELVRCDAIRCDEKRVVRCGGSRKKKRRRRGVSDKCVTDPGADGKSDISQVPAAQTAGRGKRRMGAGLGSGAALESGPGGEYISRRSER